MKTVLFFRVITSACLALFCAGATYAISLVFPPLARAVPAVFVGVWIACFALFTWCADGRTPE